jgi:endonuclease I
MILRVIIDGIPGDYSHWWNDLKKGKIDFTRFMENVVEAGYSVSQRKAWDAKMRDYQKRFRDITERPTVLGDLATFDCGL